MKHLGDILQRGQHHLRRVRNARDRLRAHGGHQLPAIDAGDLLPSLRAVEDDAPVRILPGDDAGQRLDHQRGIDPAGLQLCARDGKVRIDHRDVLAEIHALGVGIDPHDLELRAAHVDRQLLALEVGQRLDRRVLGEDHEVGQREARSDDAKRHTLLIELLQDRRSPDQHIGLARGEGRVESGDRRIGLDVELEAVLHVEAARLHDVPDQRIEHRQGQAGDFEDRLLLRLSRHCQASGDGEREHCGKHGQPA